MTPDQKSYQAHLIAVARNDVLEAARALVVSNRTHKKYRMRLVERKVHKAVEALEKLEKTPCDD